MPKYKIKKKDSQLIIRAKLKKKETLNERELDFYMRKSIRGLMKAVYKKKLAFKGIEYTGPTGISLSERIEKEMTRYDFFFILEQIADMIRRLKKNSMPIQKIVWDMKYIFINETTREMWFIYLPLDVAPQEVSILAFIENMVYASNITRKENTEYVTEFIYFLKGLRQLDAEQIENYIQKKEPEIVNMVRRTGAGESGFITDKPKDYYAHYYGAGEEDDATGLLNADPDEEEEATGLLNQEEEEATGLLTEGTETGEETKPHFPTLYRASSEEQIFVDKPVFRLGKERSYADYFISNNPAVSRSHADVITRDGSYYIIDLNSKNRTYINDQVIPAQIETKLHDGDTIRLGNEVFVFYT